MYSTERISECSVIFNTVPCTALKEYLKVQLSSIQYHEQHWKNIWMLSYLQYSTTYSTERISESSVIFNTVPCTALKEYLNAQLSSIQYHVQHWKNIWMLSYLQYSTTYSTERISESSVIFSTVPSTALKEYLNAVIFNTVPCTALKEYLNAPLSSIQYHVQHWKNIWKFSYLQYSTTYSTERISECSVIFNTVPCTVLKEYLNVQLSSIQYHVQQWRISERSVIFNTVPCTALKSFSWQHLMKGGNFLTELHSCFRITVLENRKSLAHAVSQTPNLPASGLNITSTTLALFLYSIMQKTSFQPISLAIRFNYKNSFTKWFSKVIKKHKTCCKSTLQWVISWPFSTEDQEQLICSMHLKNQNSLALVKRMQLHDSHLNYHYFQITPSI
jgi:uncharacterized membrane protein